VQDNSHSDAYGPSSRREEYVARVNLVIDHIEANIDGPLSLEEIARVAGFSRFHFHRLFAALVGETLSDYIKRIRLDKAAVRLVANPRLSITEVALACGFSGPATFARAFRQTYAMSASQWRAEQSKKCKALRKERKDQAALSRYATNVPQDNAVGRGGNEEIGRQNKMNTIASQVVVEEMPEVPVAYVRHIGPYKGDSELFARLFGKLMGWAGARDLLRFPETKTLVIYHDDPEITDENRLRFDVCVTVPADTVAEGEIGRTTIPGGKCALARFEIGADEFQGAWNYVFGAWLPESGYQPDDRPCYELYHNDAKEHPQGKHILDICVPVRPL
jgi:AraC family transcriptional regulator